MFTLLLTFVLMSTSILLFMKESDTFGFNQMNKYLKILLTLFTLVLY